MNRYFYATAVCLPLSRSGKSGAILLCGPSGCGKSDLALRLIKKAGARLISDDQVILTRDKERLSAHPAPNISGKLEVRGLGIVDFPATGNIPVFLVIDLATPNTERLPDPQTILINEVAIPRVALDPFETSIIEKVQTAVQMHED